tara:strand:+ start:1855 stop:3138 length:1284 start_codon:yes stop_codon:yes gene_type:complete
MSTVAFHTFGCKLNFSETSTISRMFKENGYQRTTITNNPDKVIINTCSVTENADKRCRDLIKKIKKQSPSTKITIVGCYAQLKAESIIGIDGVDKVLGAKEKFDIKNYLDNYNGYKKSNIKEVNEFHTTFSVDDRTRSFLKIQDGCNYGCSFCTIPMARGRSRSSSNQEVLNNINSLIKRGSKEIILSGINIGDYGIIEGKRKFTFYSLIKEINQIKTNVRFRISSIEPNLLSDEIIDLVYNSDKFVNHFHIPLQSGNNKILKNMSRRYNTTLYSDRIKKIKSKMPDACIGCDVIVGFPGESDEDFLETFKFIKKREIDYLHVFQYSERNNTRAVNIKDVIPKPTRIKRSKMLRILSEKKKRNFYNNNLSLTKEIIIENGKDQKYLYGYTDNYVRVKVKRDNKILGKIKKVYLKGIDDKMNVEGLII